LALAAVEVTEEEEMLVAEEAEVVQWEEVGRDTTLLPSVVG
jgi:hypothetical protein